MAAVNIPAIYLASKKFDVISLFLVADLAPATSVSSCLGLATKDYGIPKAPTELRCLFWDAFRRCHQFRQWSH
jgi:hypothetical protein